MPSAGREFHCLQATSQALQPMQMVESVKKPIGSWAGGGEAMVMPSSKLGLMSDSRPYLSRSVLMFMG